MNCELAQQLTEIADGVELEMYELDIDGGSGYWVIQAIVRLRMAAVWAAWAASPEPRHGDPHPFTMRDTERLMGWLDPSDARRLRDRIDHLLRLDTAACAGERLLKQLLGEG